MSSTCICGPLLEQISTRDVCNGDEAFAYVIKRSIICYRAYEGLALKSPMQDEPSDQTRPRRCKRLKARFRRFFENHWTFLLLIYGVAASYYVLIDWRVNRILNDEDFIEKVASRARPAMVFDQNSRIISDSGALKFLETMPVFGTDAKGNLQIVIKSKEWMAAEPIVESLDMGAVSVQAERGIGTAWTVSLWQRYMPVVDVEHPPSNAAPLRFRLELSVALGAR